MAIDSPKNKKYHFLEIFPLLNIKMKKSISEKCKKKIFKDLNQKSVHNKMLRNKIPTLC